MFKLRYYLRLTFAFITRFKGILVLGVGMGFVLFLIIRFLFPLISSKDVQRIGMSGRFITDKLPLDVLELISQGLTSVDKSGKAQPALAKIWESLDGGKTWVFKLGNHTWQDGGDITSDTINYRFEDVEIQRPDKETIVFKLESPFTAFPTVLSKPIFKKGLLGTGPWKVVDLSVAGNFVEKITLKNNEKQKKVIKFFPSEERTKLAFKLGEIDIIYDLIDPKPFDKWKNVQIDSKDNEQRVVVIFYNTADKYLANKSLRQVLSYAIDKDSFGKKRAIGPISPNSWAYNPQIKEYLFNQKRARELISELPDEIIKDLSVNLVTTPPLLETAERIASFWQEVGVSSSVQVTSVLPSEYQAFLVMYDIPKDPDQYSTWHSQQAATNISKYKNPRIDKLLEDGRQELDFEERKKIYFDFQRFLLEDAPATFLFHPVSYTVIRK